MVKFDFSVSIFFCRKLLTSLTELSQMFPTLDDDLSLVGKHLTINQFSENISKQLAQKAAETPKAPSPLEIEILESEAQNEGVRSI